MRSFTSFRMTYKETVILSVAKNPARRSCGDSNERIFLGFLRCRAGRTLRFAVIRFMAQFVTANYYAIFICNLVGCFLAGMILSYIMMRQGQSWINLFFITGLAGGFTTFSAFSVDAIQMLQKSDFTTAIFYIMGSVIAGLVFCGRDICG